MALIKKLIKRAYGILAIPFAIPFIVIVILKILRFRQCSIFLSIFPGYFGILVRRFYYQNLLQRCGKNLTVHFGAFFVYRSAEVGDNCTFEEYCIMSNVNFGNDIVSGARVSFMSGAHHHNIKDLHTPMHLSMGSFKKITIGDDVWFGTHSIVMANVKSRSVVGAGAVVTKTFEEFDILAGVPAKKIGNRQD